MCLSKAEGGTRCGSTPNGVVNARRRVARTYTLLLDAKNSEDQDKVDELSNRLKTQTRAAGEEERTHVSTFINPYSRLNEEETKELVDSLIESDEYKELLDNRNKARNDLEAARTDVNEAKERHKLTGSEEDYEKLREARFASTEAYFNYLDQREELDQYKNNTALVASRLSEVTTFEQEHEGDTLGNTIKTVTHPSGSREWLEQRQNGIGGSDVGDILRLHPDYGSDNYAEAYESKISAISDEEVEEQETNQETFSGPAGRGNAWEPIIAQQFAEENPQYTLIHSKSSWVNPDRPWQFANVDGLLSDREDGEPNGILEVKTASNEKDWDDGIPPGYRAQVLHYLDATGFDYAHVAVRIDDQEYRSYSLKRTDPIDPNDPERRTYEDRRPELENFWSRVQKTKTNPEALRTISKSDFSWQSKNKKNIVRDVAAWRQEEPEEVKARIESSIDAGEDPNDVIRREYTDHDPSTRTKDTVSIDLETSGYTPESGEIIEIGITRRSPSGEVLDTYQEVFGVDQRALRVNGTGAQSVHNISPEDVEGKRGFRDPEVQNKVQGMFKDSVMVAHNASFEKTWLNQYLDGFHSADVPTVDTMQLSRYFAHDTNNNRLETFAPRYGVPYRDAHRALVDAEMTADALHNFTEEITGKKIK